MELKTLSALPPPPHLRIKMILNAFSIFLKANKHEILNGNTTAIKLLCKWIRMVIAKNPKNNIDKIVQTEITLAENKYGDFLIVGNSESGRVLVNALYNYAMSYEHYIMQKWLDDKNPDDFKI